MRYKFPNIPDLNNALELLEKTISDYAGKEVKELPPINQTVEGTTFFIKQTDGVYFTYRKIGNSFRQMKVDSNSQVYWE